MKKINYYLTLCFALVGFGLFAQGKKVIGYFPSYRATTNVSAQCEKLTDIIFSFINPNTDGTLITSNPSDALYGFDMNKYLIVRDAAAAKGTNLWLSLGGADASELRAARLSSVCQNSTFRNTLATALVNFATSSSTSCYGLSIDWEFPKDNAAKTAHKDFMVLLKQKIAASSNPNLKVAVAVGGETKNSINHANYLDPTMFTTNINTVDEWHIMAYDFPSGNNYDVTNHSTTADAQASLEGWNLKGVPYSKMVLGVPFYGRGTGTRSFESMYNEYPKNNTTYTSDVVTYNSVQYGYNGINTLKAKIDLMVNKAAMGILIWDLGQDHAPSDQYSLLGGMDTYLSTLCNIPKPNLGPDKGVCAPNSVTLDPAVAAANGRTFAWYKDGNLQNGQSGITFSASTAGTYKVVISQGSGCSKEDEIIVAAGSPFTTTGASGCVGDNLTLSVNNPAVGKSYKWYDAATSGALLYTGTSYSAIFNANTTVHVEEASAGVSTYTTSPSDVPAGKFYAWAGTQYTYRCAQLLDVETDLKVKSLRMITSRLNGITFSVKVINATNLAAVTTVGPFTKTGTPGAASSDMDFLDFDVNITLTPGKYFIYPEPTSGNEGNYGIINGYFEESKQTGVYTLKGSTFQRSSSVDFTTTDEGKSWWAAHGPFLKWVIETGANASCGRTAATASVVTCGPPAVTINTPTLNQAYGLQDNVNVNATVTDEGTVSSVVMEIWFNSAKVTTLSVNQSGSTYTATWPTGLNTPGNYTVKVIATDNNSNTKTENQTFTVSVTQSVNTFNSANEVVIFPNPSADNMNVSVDLIKGGQASLVVYDLAGRTVYSNVQSMNSGKNLSTVDVSSLAAGSYLLNISVNGETVNKAFSVVK